MNHRLAAVWIVAAGIACAGWIFLLSGCESQSSDTQITISPGGATITAGESVAFTAEGGYDYTWSLSDPNLGTLNTRTGPTVVYTASSSSSSGSVQTLTVVSTIEGAPTSSTSTNSAGGYNGSDTATASVQISQY